MSLSCSSMFLRHIWQLQIIWAKYKWAVSIHVIIPSKSKRGIAVRIMRIRKTFSLELWVKNVGRVHIPYTHVTTLQQDIDNGNVESILAVCSSNRVSSWNYFESLLFRLLGVFFLANVMCEYVLLWIFTLDARMFECLWNGWVRYNV